MPAYPEEIEDALKEGVEIHYLTAPVGIHGENGKVSGFECIKTELGPADESGRRRPTPIADSEFVIACDAVISAIGQEPEADCVEDCGIGISRRNRLLVKDKTMQTAMPDVFSAGDSVTGPATVIDAAAGGTRRPRPSTAT